jgi:two-component system chemotaxis response regulator CheY
MKVLMIDDSEMQHKIASIYLEKSYTDCEIFHAYNGAQGVQMAKEIIPELILLDVEMPELDGVGALSLLKSSEATREIPVIMCTSVDKESILQKCTELGAAGYIHKPHGYKHLMDEMNKIFKKQSGPWTI